MATTGLRQVLDHLHPPGGGLTDAQLLTRFVTSRDEASFAALVRRHGPMVLAVCRRLLGHAQDAEDAFQATFLVLARKAGSVVKRESVGSWLHGVACRTAMQAASANARRRARERQVVDMPHPEVMPEEAYDWLPLLDQELGRLPEKYRAAVVLCDLEGRSRREAARQLGVPEGTLSSRLMRARKLLARRLARYGLALSGGALAAVLSEKTASARVTSLQTTSTAKAAVLVAAGQALTAGAVPARVVALTEGVIKTMLLTKLRAFVAVVVVAFVSAGVVGLAYRTTAAEPSTAAAQPAADDLEALRLEVEALRKSLQATRERVKTLEGEVASLKGQKAGGGGGSAATTPKKVLELGIRPPKLADEKVRDLADQKLREAREAADPLADAEAALKKLREHPDDKQAADALEQALKRLKERAKPEGGTEKPQKH
jgi:RNA polymerase sigma factor (sigma-70 family)